MARFMWNFPVLIVILFIVYSCGNYKSEEKEILVNTIDVDSNHVLLQFDFEINKKVYLKTNYGQPPQIAIWIENPDSSIVKTVWVTRCTAKQEWKGKVECPVSLPYWEYRATQERQDSSIDAVSGATPLDGSVSANILVPQKSQWNVYIEVNVSADYNNTFSYWSREGLPDPQANGQPSIVYTGKIIADGRSQLIPVLSGRTDQRHVMKELSTDLNGITTAKNLVGKIEVRSIFKSKTEN